jgi:hypothetical protein
MTQHVRTGYRNHRKAAWGLALLLVAAIATVTIPLASGAPTKTLQFVTQPPVALQKTAPATTASVSVAVFSGGPNAVNSQGQAPSLSATGAGTIDDFVVDGPTYDGNTNRWTWSVMPNSTADEGFYNFVATLGNLAPATSNPFRVAQFVCPPSGGPSCDATSDVHTGAQGEGKLKIANTLGSPIALDFNPGGDADGCHGYNWPSRASFLDSSGNSVYFPAVTLDFDWDGSGVLQITYRVRNSEWVITNAARGNNDAEFCAAAKHQDASNNGPDGDAFIGKYGEAIWDDGFYWGVLATVSNPSKVKSGGDPAVCARGSQEITTGGVTETWRTWTICIPHDWDWGIKPG